MEQQRDILAVTDSAIESMAMFNLGTAQLEEARSQLCDLVRGPFSTLAELKRLKSSLEFDERLYGANQKGRSTLDFPAAIKIVDRAIAGLSRIEVQP